MLYIIRKVVTFQGSTVPGNPSKSKIPCALLACTQWELKPLPNAVDLWSNIIAIELQ